MASQPARQTHAYLPIDWFPEYQTFSYQFDYVTVIVILLFICSIPSVFATVKMILFYLKTSTRNGSKEIHPYVFKSFLCMQFCNIIATVIDFIVYRIPYTTLVTSYFATMKFEIIIRYLVAALYAFNYMSQLYTVLFCFIRVLVLFYPRTHSEIYGAIFKVWSFVSCLFSVVVSFPNILSKAIGIQLDFPFQYGAINFTTMFSYTSVSLFWSRTMPQEHEKLILGPVFKRLQNIGDAVFSSIIAFCIVTMTLVMIIKMKTLKFVDQNSKLKAKAETTLKITMCIILIPSMMSQIFAMTCFYATRYPSYIILVRPILLDCRVNIVSCYFYWTHPYFKQRKILNSVNVKSLSTN